MAKENNPFKPLLTVISVAALVIFGGLFVFGKARAMQMVSSFLKKAPKNENEVVKMTESVLGTAAEKIKSGDQLKKAVEKGSEFFESSSFTEPAREIREDVKSKIDEAVEAAKQLPAKELEVIKNEVCKEWFTQNASNSAGN